MTTPRSDLRLLLQLMDGSIPSADREAVRARMADDKVLRTRWQQLNSVQQPTNGSSQTEDEFKPDDVAAFLDGMLSPQEETAFETRCWNSPAVLFELLSLSGTGGEVDVSPELSNRLLKMVPAAASAEESVEETLIDLHTEPRESRVSRRGTGVSAAALIASAVVVLLLASTLWIVMRDSQPKQIVKDEKQPTVQESPETRFVETPTPEDEDLPKDQPNPELVPESDPPINKPGSMVVETPIEPRTNPQPKDLPNTPDPAPAIPKSTSPKVASALWETRGVVAVRASVREPWHGLNAIDRPADAEFLTLVTSRAVTKGPAGVEFVISQESEVAGLTWGEVAEVQVKRGSAAFRMLKKDDTVRFVLGEKVWEASATVDDTSVAVSLSGLEPRLIVWAGKADVGKVRIARQSGIVFSKPREVAKLSSEEAKGYGWVDAWSQSQFNDTSLARLMNSKNLRTDILAMGSGRKVTMMVAPELAVFRLLNSKAPAERQAALWWLMNNPDLGPGSVGRLAWTDIEQSVGNATVTGYMKSWLDKLRTGRPIQLAEAQQMVRALGITPRAVQFVAIACLQHYTGVTRGFDPNAGNAARRAAINRWATWLRSQ
ncbi:MAG: hypothetical protein AB8G99_13275 [Planctomycetaceae bacterium]